MASAGVALARKSWAAAIHRCHGARAHRHYGGRGITVCARWRASFESFLADMGPRPDGASLDRIDVNGNYDPGNCRWATDSEQRNNKRTSHILTIDGASRTVAEWSRIANITWETIDSRLRRGMDHKRAVFDPITDWTVTVNGESMNATQWAARIGITPTSMQLRIKRWGPERAVTTPRLRPNRNARRTG